MMRFEHIERIQPLFEQEAQQTGNSKHSDQKYLLKWLKRDEIGVEIGFFSWFFLRKKFPLRIEMNVYAQVFWKFCTRHRRLYNSFSIFLNFWLNF